MSPFISLMSQEKIFDKIRPFFNDLSGEIVCSTHTETNIFFATKASSINRFPYFQNPDPDKNQLQNPDPVKSQLQFNDGTPRAMLTIKFGEKYILLVLAKDKLYMLKEENWPGKFMPANISNVSFITTNDAQDKLVVVEPKEIKVYIYTNENFELSASVQHKTYPIDIAAGISHLMILENKNYYKYDLHLKFIEKQQVSNCKCLRVIKGSNSFAAVNGTSIKLFNNSDIDQNNLEYGDEIVLFEIIPPYIFALTSRGLIVRSTVGTIKEEFPYASSFKVRYSCMEITPNFNVLMGSKKEIFILKYDNKGPENHIKHLIENNPKQWENAIAFCNIIRYPGFNNKEKLSEIYLLYAQNLVSAQRYKEAFDKFTKSLRHPFEILSSFPTFATKSLKEAAIADIQKTREAYFKVLETLKELTQVKGEDLLKNKEIVNRALENSKDTSRYAYINPEAVYQAVTELHNVTQSREEIPSVKNIVEMYSDIAKDAIHGILDLHNVEKNAEKLHIQRIINKPFRDDGAIYPLQQYLKQILQSEHISTCIKIYNTILFQCYAMNTQPTELQKEIKKNPPIFFSIVEDTLRKQQQQEAFIDLCELHGQHDIAIKSIIGRREIDRAISYLRNSKDCLTQAKNFFDEILKELTSQALDPMQSRPKADKAVYPIQYINPNQKKAAEIFCSPILSSSDVDSVVAIISKNDKIDEELKNNLLTRFLEFAIYDRGLLQKSIVKQLVDIYLNLLKEKKKFGSSRSLICNEKEPIKGYREGLKYILEAIPSSEFDVDIITSIDNIFTEEKLIAYRKIKSFDDALDLIIKSDKKPENGEKRLEYDLYLLDCYYDPSIPSTMEIYNKYLFEMRNSPEMRDYTAEFVNKCADRIKPDAAIDFIDTNTPIADISEFLKFITTSNLNKSRLAQIKNGLLDDVKRNKEQQLKYLKGGYVEVDNNTRCAVCGKPISNTIFYVLKDNFIAHSNCKPKSE